MENKKRVNGSRKGSAFEREICKKLSLWFSHGNREDLFHRTAGSGARSTVRAKKGKATANSAGDIGYLDAIGKPLIEAITFELKCGYNHADTTALIDTLPQRKKPQLLEFVWQAVISSQNAKSRYWAVIHKRNGKQTLIHFPLSMWMKIQEHYNETTDTVMAEHYTFVQVTYLPSQGGGVKCVVATPLTKFLEVVPPEVFCQKSAH
jgi:hypothetical protein